MDLLKENFHLKTELSSRNNLIRILEEDLVSNKKRESALISRNNELEAKLLKFKEILKFIKRKKKSSSPTRKKTPKNPNPTGNASEDENSSLTHSELPISFIDKDFSMEMTESMLNSTKDSFNKTRAKSAIRGYELYMDIKKNYFSL
jgi:hypothetical protein